MGSETTLEGGATSTVAPRARSPRAIAFERLRRDRVGIVAAVVALVVVLGCFVGAPVASRLLGHGPNDPFPYAVDVSTRPVGPLTWVPAVSSAQTDDFGELVDPVGVPRTLLVLGADGSLGRDLFLRILYGGIVSITVGLLAVAIALVIGLVAGSAAGMLGGAVDGTISRLTELAMSLPVLFLLVLVGSSAVGERMQDVTLGVFNQGVLAVALIIGLFTWFYPARIVRVQIQVLRRREFVDAAIVSGAGRWRILRQHLFPHLVPPLAAWATTGVAIAILFEIGVSFLNAGVRLPTSSWGRLLTDTWGSPLSPSRFNPVYQSMWPTVFTSIAIFLTIVAIYELGEALQRALVVEHGR